MKSTLQRRSALLVGAAAGTATIRGRVPASATSDPIRNARVIASGEHGRAIVLAAGQVVEDVVIELRRGAAISGIVADAAGEPVAGASVMIERPASNESVALPVRVGRTDDLGQYRVGAIDGVISDAPGRPVDGGAAVAFPVDSIQRYEQSRFVAGIQADRSGYYHIEGLPPGEYYVAAIDRRSLGAVRAVDDGDVFESLVPGAARVTPDDAAHITVAVRLPDR